MNPKPQRNRRRSVLTTIFCSLVLGLTALLFVSVRSPRTTEAAASQFDQMFGSHGFVSTDVSAGEDDLTSIALQSDGKTLAAAPAEPQLGRSAWFATT